jgi:hypothetical protein
VEVKMPHPAPSKYSIKHFGEIDSLLKKKIITL